MYRSPAESATDPNGRKAAPNGTISKLYPSVRVSIFIKIVRRELLATE